MIIEIFGIFLLLSLLLIPIGYLCKSPALMIGGTSFIFILGIVVLLGGLQYATGKTSYVTGNYTQTNTTYGAYTAETFIGIDVVHLLGFFMCILGVFGFISTFVELGEMNIK